MRNFSDLNAAALRRYLLSIPENDVGATDTSARILAQQPETFLEANERHIRLVCHVSNFPRLGRTRTARGLRIADLPPHLANALAALRA